MPASAPVIAQRNRCCPHAAVLLLGTVRRIANIVVPGERIELPTNGLQNRCSTAELTRLSVAFAGAYDTPWPFRRNRRLLPFCYPISLGTLLYGYPERVVNKGGGIRLHVRQHVAVEVQA